MKKKILALTAVVALALCAVSLMGCGGSKTETPKTEPAKEAPAQKGAAKPEGEKTQASAEGGMKLVKPGTLICASNFQFPPFEYMDNGKPAGFSVEFMDLLAKKAGLTSEWAEPLKFDTLLPLVKQGGKIDVACASITINDQRKKEIDFTDPYLDSNQGVAVLKDGPFKTAKDLNADGKKIGVQSGTTGEAWAKENVPAAQLVVFDDTVSAFNALQAGKVDAVISDLPVEKWMAKTSFTNVKVIEEVPTGEQYGVVVSKDNPELTKALNKALAEIKADGSYQKLLDKYFGE